MSLCFVPRTLQTFCFSYPGQSNALVNAGANEQRLTITRGPNGCLDGSLRSIMKLFAILVGKRNEHQRGDRDQYISVNQNNVIVPVRISVCLSSEMSVRLGAFVSVCLSVCLSVCQSIYLFVCLSVCLFVCLSVCLSVWLSDFLSICLLNF